MPRTIEEGFKDFHDGLKIFKTESELLTSHRESIQSCLINNFDLTNFFRTGSIGNGTNVGGYSDTDYFAVIPTENLKSNSQSTLREVKEALQKRFSDTENIHIDSPAVVIPFGTKKSETTEVIPAYYVKTADGANVYKIPDSYGEWMKASPMAHNNYVTQINKNHGFKVKPLIRFIKAWKFYCNVPISSFYLEMRVAKYANQEDIIIYATDVLHILRELQNNQLALMQDPTEISGYIHACNTKSQEIDALSKLETAYKRAQKAYDLQQEGKIKESFEYWGLLFNGEFPSYYR